MDLGSMVYILGSNSTRCRAILIKAFTDMTLSSKIQNAPLGINFSQRHCQFHDTVL